MLCLYVFGVLTRHILKKIVRTMKSRLTLLRHGATGLGNKMIGWTDAGLVEDAKIQLTQTKSSLSGQEFSHILCSPLTRCIQTAEILGYRERIEIWDDLREIYFGSWEGMDFQEIFQKFPNEAGRLGQWDEGFCFPDGECIKDFLLRIDRICAGFSRFDQGNILVITHGGIIRQLICRYLRLPAKNYLLFDIKAGMYSSLDLFSEGGILTALNAGGM